MILHQTKPLPVKQRAYKLGLNPNQWLMGFSKEKQQAIAEIKRKKAPGASEEEWHQKGYHQLDLTSQLTQCQRTVCTKNSNELSFEQFKIQHQLPKIPLIIQGCTEKWTANEQWKFKNLLQKYGEAKFKVAQDQDGNKLKLTLQDYVKYLLTNKDDSPLYLFEQGLKSPQTCSLQQDYQVPQYFRQDLFEKTYQERPPYRWYQPQKLRLIIGPQRSGTPVHIDPLMTSAWNTSIIGRKRWVLFDKTVPKWMVRGCEFGHRRWAGQASYYFAQVLPKIKEKYGSSLGLVEFIQEPGETVFVPGGVWHAVLNITDTLAITQNYAPPQSFDSIWRVTRQRTPDFATALLKSLQQSNERLYQRAVQLDLIDKHRLGQKYSQQSVSLSFTPSQSSCSSHSTSHEKCFQNVAALKGSEADNDQWSEQSQSQPTKGATRGRSLSTRSGSLHRRQKGRSLDK